jgi:hypothetical protein
MRDAHVITRLAAANPVPLAVPRRRRRSLRLGLVLAAAVAVAVPAVAFAGRLGDLLGIANEGSSVPAQTIGLDDALRDLQVGGTMQELGTVNGVTFYAARNAQGQFCLAITHVGEQYHRGIGCDFRADGFPSADVRALAIPPRALQGVAADGVATVEFLDANGTVLASAPVTNNLFASATTFDASAATTLVTLDADGHVLSAQRLP